MCTALPKRERLEKDRRSGIQFGYIKHFDTFDYANTSQHMFGCLNRWLSPQFSACTLSQHSKLLQMLARTNKSCSVLHTLAISSGPYAYLFATCVFALGSLKKAVFKLSKVLKFGCQNRQSSKWKHLFASTYRICQTFKLLAYSPNFRSKRV